jgi:hypothetical protein
MRGASVQTIATSTIKLPKNISFSKQPRDTNMNWHKITFSSAQVGSGLLASAHKSFNQKLKAFVDDAERVVFDSIDDELTTTLFISPKMSRASPIDLARFSATEWPAPTGAEPNLSVLVS